MNTSSDTPIQTFLAFDYGSKWTGLAVGSKLSQEPQLLKPIRVRQHKINQEELEKVLNIWQPHAFVLGIAYYVDETLSSTGKKAQEFAHYLKRKYHRPCYLVDERLSSWQATIDSKNKQLKHTEIHSQSAAVILETFLCGLENCTQSEWIFVTEPKLQIAAKY